MTRLGPLWQAIVRFWAEQEAGTAMALVRILLALTVVYDLLYIWWLDLVIPLFVAEEYGGWSHSLSRPSLNLWLHWFGASTEAGLALHAGMTTAAVALLVGFRTRVAATLLLVLWVQWTGVLPTADRGIDQLIRNILLIMVFGHFGQTLSVDAWARTGRWVDLTAVPSWPRRLILAQLVLMYTSAGFMKSGITWWPMGGLSALYFALQDPSVAAFDFHWLRGQPWFFVTQLGTLTTVLYQCTYPVVLLLLWARYVPERAGRLGGWAQRYRLEWIWLILGAWFHVNLGLVMNLGIFPWAMLALYPAWFSSDEWHRWYHRGAERWRRQRPSSTPEPPRSVPG